MSLRCGITVFFVLAISSLAVTAIQLWPVDMFAAVQLTGADHASRSVIANLKLQNINNSTSSALLISASI